MENKKALIFGITGMDGSILAELLLKKGYEVHGIIRRSATFNTQNIDHIFESLHLYHGDITDVMNIHNIIAKVLPNEIYNLSAQSHVKVSHDLENYTFQVNTLGVLSILQSVRNLNLEKTCKIYQASTSEIFGNTTNGSFKLNEDSPQKPCSVYGISKYASQQLCNMYRDAYGMFVVNSLLFNHEESRRGHTFVTQKIVNYVGEYKNFLNLRPLELKNLKPLQLGNINACRDWGSANDYMEAVWLMLQKDIPENFVIATGETHSVREFVELAFKEIGIIIEWKGTGIEEIGLKKGTNEILIQVNPKYFRDIDIECLIGDASKAKRILGWEPTTTFNKLVKDMVKAAILRKNCFQKIKHS
jgi:GDPmannose 4,6-dehydratase